MMTAASVEVTLWAISSIARARMEKTPLGRLFQVKLNGLALASPITVPLAMYSTRLMSRPESPAASAESVMLLPVANVPPSAGPVSLTVGVPGAPPRGFPGDQIRSG